MTHRFDDLQRRWRTLYCALQPTTCLQEVLADLRPNTKEITAFLQAMGEEAKEELPKKPITLKWRKQNVLVHALMHLQGPIVDLTDLQQRHELEIQHAKLLAQHDMEHFDIHEITTHRRQITQTIAADAHDRLDD